MRYLLILLSLLLHFSINAQIILKGATLRGAIVGTTNAPSGGGGGGSPLITGQTLGSTRADSQTGVGLTFTAQSTVTITALGRWVYSGNSGTHTVSLQNAAGTVLTSASVSTSGATVGAFKNVSCTPYTLTIGVRYFILSTEGGDNWGDQAAVTCDTTVTGGGGTAWNSAFVSGTPQVNSALDSYVPVNALWTP